MRYTLSSAPTAARLAGLLLGTSLAACQSNSSDKATTASKPAAEVAAAATAPPDSRGAWYRQYRGVLPGQPTDTITLHLQVWPAGTEFGGVAASYTGPDGHPFDLNGTAGPADSLTLQDYAPEHGASGSQPIVWRLRRQGSLLTGTVGGRPVELRQGQPAGSIQLGSRFFQDSVAAFPETPGTPYAQQRLLALLPASASTSGTLQESLLRGLRADTVDTQPAPTLPKLWQQRLQQFTEDYRQDAAGSRPEPGDTSSPAFGIGLRYDEQQLMHVLWNQAPLLSIGYFSYSYTGGAHGMYGTSAATFDTRTGRRLRYDDIFRAGTQPQLVALLDQAARRMLGLAPGASLEGPLFVKHLPATRNVFLTSGGAVFIYSPYEVASYAQGEIRVFVPLAELRPLLRPGLPVAGGGEVSRP
ncbi:DUF3298 and DUF4163 domain-containing protein [Hymenobacter canadensis]|uniref:DUF3298 domain-containing protein n=1 Tax=Hymenobacter canadensis TaxID=2999067 RepID=A0ABY7LI61_9BACT|nr:DUF3298 and DUF4163 domain-containing protein [Hymenobacter canadensis]WBA40144.1 DUF3298 domain-containing protein [Hymenobacter canadensis]